MKKLRLTHRHVIAFLFAVSAFVTAGQTAVADKPASPPEFEWAISAAGPEHDKTRGLAVDPDGNVLLTGEFTSTAAFGDHKRTAVGSMDFFVAKVSPAGKFLWVSTGGGEMIDRGYAVACDHLGNAYVTGHFQSPTAKFNDVTVKNTHIVDRAIIKRFPAGKRRGDLPGQRFEISLAECPPFRGANELGLSLKSTANPKHAPYMEELEIIVSDVSSE